jgi:hypothetical protein
LKKLQAAPRSLSETYQQIALKQGLQFK